MKGIPDADTIDDFNRRQEEERRLEEKQGWEENAKGLIKILTEKTSVKVPREEVQYGQQYGKFDFGEYEISRKTVYEDSLVLAHNLKERRKAHRELKGILSQGDARHYIKDYDSIFSQLRKYEKETGEGLRERIRKGINVAVGLGVAGLIFYGGVLGVRGCSKSMENDDKRSKGGLAMFNLYWYDREIKDANEQWKKIIANNPKYFSKYYPEKEVRYRAEMEALKALTRERIKSGEILIDKNKNVYSNAEKYFGNEDWWKEKFNKK